MMNFLPSIFFERWDCFACLTPILSAPTGVERGGGDRGRKNTTVESRSRLGQAQSSRGERT
jgi:hypothetical protein